MIGITLSDDAYRAVIDKRALYRCAHLINVREVPKLSDEPSIKYLTAVFDHAHEQVDITGARARFAWYGEEEAQQVISVLYEFFQTYYEKECKEAKQLVPFTFASEEAREEILSLLMKISKTMSERRMGFPMWPPPRTVSCF